MLMEHNFATDVCHRTESENFIREIQTSRRNTLYKMTLLVCAQRALLSASCSPSPPERVICIYVGFF